MSNLEEYPFLRIRKKRPESVRVVVPTTPPEITVNVSELIVRPVRGDSKEPLELFTPVIHGNVELSLESPVIRLDDRQSAIGSLIIEHAQAFAWEMQDFLSGIKVITGSGESRIEPPEYGNRPILAFQDNRVIMNLRHGHHIRRVVLASNVNDLRVHLFDGSEIFVPMNHGANALTIHRIGSEFELRVENIQSTDLLGVFNIIPSQVSR